MWFEFAFRNVLRNRRRSFLTAMAVFFGAMIVGLAAGWVNGMVDMVMQNYIIYQTGNVRVTTQEFVDRERFVPVDALIPGADQLTGQLAAIPGVQQVEERVRFGILLGHEDLTVSAFGLGLDVLHSRLAIKDKMVAGSAETPGMYIGKDLAKKLGVRIGDQLLLATKTSEGGLNGIKLPVAGIFNLGIGMFNRKTFIIRLEDAKRLLKISGGTTEIFVYTEREDLTDRVTAAVRGLLPDGVVGKSYKELMGPLYSLYANMGVIYIFVEALILFLASFVVINTMMMAIFERLHEIGTLKAIGMTDRELFVNFTLEGGLIGAMGGIPGALLGYGLVTVAHFTGLNLEASLDALEMPLDNIFHPTLSIWVLFLVIGLSIVVPALAAMIPARYARKLLPAEALRK